MRWAIPIALVFTILAFEPARGAEVEPARAPRRVVPFDQLPRRVQLRFEREAEQYLRIGDDVWSIEVWLRLQRSGKMSAEALEPYAAEDAPIFYNPATDQRARTLGDIDPKAGELVLIYGSPMATTIKHGGLVNTRRGIVCLTDTPVSRDDADRAGRVLIVAEPDQTIEVATRNGRVKIPAVAPRDDAFVRPASAGELAEHFQRHGIDRFEQWRYRKVWDEKPEAQRVYQSAENRGAGTDTGGRIGAGTSEPREVVTDAGKYHYQWLRGGSRIPPLRAAERDDDDGDGNDELDE